MFVKYVKIISKNVTKYDIIMALAKKVDLEFVI